MLNEDKRTVEEAYCAATMTSDMRVVTDHTQQGDAETIMAAGMSKNIAGACFMRLHGEWARSEKPRPPTVDAVKKLAESLTFDQLAKMRIDLKLSSIGNLKPSPVIAHMAAEGQAKAWYLDEVCMLLGKLKSFREAVAHVSVHLGNWDKRPDVSRRRSATMVLVWWLDQKCKACDGTQWELSSGSNRQSNRPCKSCRGTGEARLPMGDDGRRLANFIDECVFEARDSIKKRLRRTRSV